MVRLGRRRLTRAQALEKMRVVACDLAEALEGLMTWSETVDREKGDTAERVWSNADAALKRAANAGVETEMARALRRARRAGVIK